MGGLLEINSLNLIRISAVNTTASESFYKIVDSSVRKCIYRIVYMEDRYAPNVFYLSVYDKNYKSEYKINRIINGGATATFKFIYDTAGAIYFTKGSGTRGGMLSVQLVLGDTQAKIENVENISGTEIPIV